MILQLFPTRQMASEKNLDEISTRKRKLVDWEYSFYPLKVVFSYPICVFLSPCTSSYLERFKLQESANFNVVFRSTPCYETINQRTGRVGGW